MNIEQLLQDLTKINGEIDHHTNTGDHFMINQLRRKRESLINNIKLELERLKDFDNWKEWNNT